MSRIREKFSVSMSERNDEMLPEEKLRKLHSSGYVRKNVTCTSYIDALSQQLHRRKK